ncbi:polysaccharide biosynthesis protein [Magnetococcales bacterium HHB-1]
MLNYIYHLLNACTRNQKKMLIIFYDLLGAVVALWLAFVLRLNTWWPDYLDNNWIGLIIAPVILFVVASGFRLYRQLIRFSGMSAVFSITKAVTLSTLILITLALMSHAVIPRSVFVIYWALLLLIVGGGRMGIRALTSHFSRFHGKGVKVAIYGAGASGRQLIKSLENHHGIYKAIVFVDDNPDLHSSEIFGLKVIAASELKETVQALEITQVLLAIPSLSKQRRQEILSFLAQLPITVKTLPSLEHLVSGQVNVEAIRAIDIEDLLGRDPVPPVAELLEANTLGKSVAVTGAGGSIGSELAKQILKQRPSRLILYDHAEYNLYRVEQKLLPLVPSGCELIPLLGSVRDKNRLCRALSTFRVETVFHAAAYKHVPIVEQNPIEGVINNVFGTLVAAQTAIHAGVSSFVLISTDKAVRPSSVMGTTKRLAELILQGLSEKEGVNTRFVMVRFGNVLDSSGSVVPLFRRQIREGGPVTVTHPEVQRFFMTISEAAQLVIQAGAMGKGGDVFVLDMGEPVKIYDLACKMVRLSGLEVRDKDHPDGDISMEIVGLRPGEKLVEELLIGDNVTGTRHPHILRALEYSHPWPQIRETLDRLENACQQFDSVEVEKILTEVVPEFHHFSGNRDFLRSTSPLLTLCSKMDEEEKI